MTATQRQLAEAFADDLVSDMGDVPPSLAAMIRQFAIDGVMGGSEDATQAYQRAMNRDTEDSHFEGMPKQPQHSGDLVNAVYDGAGNMSQIHGKGLVFDVIRDGAGRIKSLAMREE